MSWLVYARPLTRFVAATLALLAVLAGLALTPTLAQSDQRCFPETGLCISGRIREFWQQNGGLAVFGFPITPQRTETVAEGSFEAQWFERARLELHPENARPYDVLLGRLGADRLAQQGRNWMTFPSSDPATRTNPNCLYFAETNQSVCGLFLQAFRSNGLNFANTPGVSFEESLALWGLPLSPPQTETIDGWIGTVQWFERGRFEYHPQNPPPFDVLFGRMGAEILVEFLQPQPTPTAAPPTATPGAGPGGCTPRMTFVRDVAVPNGSTLAPGARFIRIWRVRNDGSCYWDNFRLIFARGDQMSGPASVAVPFAAPGASVDISVPLTAPNSAGTYRGFWVMQADNGTTFDGLVVEINVAEGATPTAPPATPTATEPAPATPTATEPAPATPTATEPAPATPTATEPAPATPTATTLPAGQ